MTLPLELGGIQDFNTRRALEHLSLQFPIGANQLANAATVTALPGAPINGMEVYYLADSTNGVVWHLKYRSASASASKWECVGGPPLFAEVTTTQGTASTTYAALATAGPTVALPLAGDYLVSIGARIEQTVAAAYAGFMSYDIGGTGAVDNDAIIGTSSGVSDGANNFRTRVKTGLTAVTLTAKYRSQVANNVNFSDRHMLVMPVRVG